MKKLLNKVALITGAGSGMGKAIALLFASEGCKVIASDVNQDRLDNLQLEILASGGLVTIQIANVAKDDEVEAMIAKAVSTYGTLDILINNAGIMDNFAPVGDLDDNTWERVMKVNVDGPMKAMRSALKIFLAKGSGIIVNIASLGGLAGARAGAAYTASKHALIGLTKNTGYMYSKLGIRCNAVAPGAVNTNIGQTIDFNKITPLVNDRIMTGLALNPRIGNPEEVAKVALFLSCDDSSFLNATTVIADGGWFGY